MERPIHISKGSVDSARLTDFAEVVHEAFGEKLLAIGIRRETAVEMIVRSADPGSAFVAYQGDDPVGVAGLTTRNSRFLEFRLSTLREYFNLPRSVFYYLILDFEDRVAAGEIKIESLAVAENMRGQGIGTKLIHAVEQYAGGNGFSTLSLDVVDTNTAAFRLYSRLGFEVVKTTRFGFLTRRAGFTASHYMRKKLPRCETNS